MVDASTDAADGSTDAGAVCNGYEPCAQFPVAPPAGYTPVGTLTVSNGAMTTSCTDLASCDMWNTHYTSIWVMPSSSGGYNPYYNRMGSPFPWSLSRYVFSVAPSTVSYGKLHVLSPGDAYVYDDGTKEMSTDRTTSTSTCYARGTGTLKTGRLESLGGTGNLGLVDWNISLLPGDMGNTGNASTCHGNGNTVSLPLTSDPATAATMSQGKYQYCLLREGHDYYVNFMSSGATCTKQDCSFGGFVFVSDSTSDGSDFTVSVPCQ